MSMPNTFITQQPFTVYAKCLDASLPDMATDMWLAEGEVYVVRGMGLDPVMSVGAVVVEDRAGNHIKPNDSVDAIRASRFKFHIVCNN